MSSGESSERHTGNTNPGEFSAGRRLGRYEVLTALASGGMATVYIGCTFGIAGFQRLLAIKVLHPHFAHEDEFISMFLDEARLAARINHPNVVATHDVSDSGGDGFFLVMDYIEGHHLGAILQQAARENHRVPATVAVRVVLDALAGLEAAHTLKDELGNPLNVIHRDVSPHNIIVGVDGVSRLTDFGVAKAEVRLAHTQEGHFKGKLSYMSPEHAQNGHLDQRSDLFAMGIILWETLTGRRLFRGETSAQILQKVLNEEVPLASGFDPNLRPFDALLQKALAKNRDDRFQTAEEFAIALEDVAQANGGIATARTTGELVRKLAAEKIANEKARVARAIEELDRGSVHAKERPMRHSSPPPAPLKPKTFDSAYTPVVSSDEMPTTTGVTANETVGDTASDVQLPEAIEGELVDDPTVAPLRNQSAPIVLHTTPAPWLTQQPAQTPYGPGNGLNTQQNVRAYSADDPQVAAVYPHPNAQSGGQSGPFAPPPSAAATLVHEPSPIGKIVFRMLILFGTIIALWPLLHHAFLAPDVAQQRAMQPQGPRQQPPPPQNIEPPARAVAQPATPAALEHADAGPPPAAAKPKDSTTRHHRSRAADSTEILSNPYRD